MKTSLTMRVMRHQNRLPRETVDVSTLVLFKAKLDGALDNVVESLSMTGGLELDYL